MAEGGREGTHPMNLKTITKAESFVFVYSKVIIVDPNLWSTVLAQDYF